jgi:hyperosmotically inducible protein
MSNLAMKKSLVALSLLLAVFSAGCSKEQTAQAKQNAAAAAEKTKEVAVTVADKTAEAAVKAKDAIANKMTEWKLSPDDLKEDFRKTGRIVRTKTAVVGQKVGAAVDDVRIVTAIKSKYATDHYLSVFSISVSSDKGLVTLSGSVKQLDHAGRAVALALDTEGVTSVVSLLSVSP